MIRAPQPGEYYDQMQAMPYGQRVPRKTGKGGGKGGVVGAGWEEADKRKRRGSRSERRSVMQMHGKQPGRVPVGTWRMPNSPAPLPTYLYVVSCV